MSGFLIKYVDESLTSLDEKFLDAEVYEMDAPDMQGKPKVLILRAITYLPYQVVFSLLPFAKYMYAHLL